MADGKKAEKLAAARQMLKKFQQTKETRIRTPEPPPSVGLGNTEDGTNHEVETTVEYNSRQGLSNGKTDPGRHSSEESPRSESAVSAVSHFFKHVPTDNSKSGLNFFDTISVTSVQEKVLSEPQESVENLVAPAVTSYPSNNNLAPESAPHDGANTGTENAANCSVVSDPLNFQPLQSNIINLRLMYEASKNELSIEKEKNIGLQKQLKLSVDQIGVLETEMKVLRVECNNRLNQEVTNLEEKLKIQLRTIEILVSEKSELHRQVEHLQEENKTKSKECEDLSGRLRASRSNVARLETEVSQLNEASRQHNNILKKLELNLQENIQQTEQYRQQLEESETEVKELKRRLDCSFSECSAIRRELEDKESQLSMAQIRMQQLGSGNGEGIDMGNSEECKRLRDEIQNLKQNIFDVTNEKDQSASQYQQYINTLNSQLQDIAAKYESLTAEKEDLKAREESLVSHISELEKQMQKQQAQIQCTSVVNTNNYSELSDQNTKLKEEVDDLKKTLQELTTQLEAKEEELVEARAELEKEREQSAELPDARLLQAAIESDKLAASRAIQQNNELKKNLTDMREAFIRLSNNKLELMEQLEHEQQFVSDLREELNRWRMKVVMKNDASTQFGLGLVMAVIDGCSQTTYHDIEGALQSNEPVSPEAIAMLEEKFRKTMNSLAELSDEKQRLEHLVLQLQGETETIGEYIALYQAQRSLLQQRACEKDQQVNAIAKEKEELRKKLDQITKLVPQLVQPSDNGEEALEKTATQGSEDSAGPASKILSLISEIGTSSLVQDKIPAETLNFHPCPLCSGRLITV